MTAPFEDPAAARMWDAYFAVFDRHSAPLGDDADALRADLQQHVLDSMAAQTGPEDPLQWLEAALARLGAPIDYLRPLLADHHIQQATRSYSPLAVGRGLFHTALAGGGRVAGATLFAIGYLFIAAFIAVAVSKPFLSDRVGLFRYPDGSIAAGIVARTAEAQELLGWWSIPVSLGLAALIYLLLTKGLRRLMRRP